MDVLFEYRSWKSFIISINENLLYFFVITFQGLCSEEVESRLF